MSRYVNMKIQAKETESLESISEMRLHVGYASDLAILCWKYPGLRCQLRLSDEKMTT